MKRITDSKNTTSSGPNRRRFLSGLGAVGATVGLSGCLGPLGGGDSPEPDIAYGDEVQGTIVSNGPRDPRYDDVTATHHFEGSDGDRVEIGMTSSEFDTFLIVTGPNGDEVVAENDDGASGPNSATLIELPADGVYTIWAGSFSGDATGEYTLTLSLR